MRRGASWWIAFGVLGCAAPPRAVTTSAQVPESRASSEVRFARTESATLACPGAAMRVDGSFVCPADARAEGLTILELADAWTPTLFAPQPDGTAPAFRATYLELAAGKTADGKALDEDEQLAELYGVVPSLAIVRERLADDERHACHAAIDSTMIARLDKPYAEDHAPRIKIMAARRRVLDQQLERERVKRGLDDVAALATVDDQRLAASYARWLEATELHAGLVAAQAHLRCEGTLATRYADGGLTWQSSAAVELFQRRNFLLPNQRLDAETREALAVDSRELDFRLALRILRERVVDATGLIEDGTASGGPVPVLGRVLDPAAMRAGDGTRWAVPSTQATTWVGAPDLIGPATEAAATQLGWTSPEAVRTFLQRHRSGLRVAVRLPAVPSYHARHMELTAVIDRGDVWYDHAPIARRVRQRPTLTLYVEDQGTRRALVRWPTTIGGWSDVRQQDGWVVQRWKESDVGPRVWQKLYAAPTWMPPPTTPDRDLVKNLYNGQWKLKSSLLGPGPHAAYGMVLLVHDREVKKHKDGSVTYESNGIGTHGSASVTSIVNGTSHGCHRMYNQLAVRLADFLLHHRTHEVKAEQRVHYQRVVRHKGRFVAKVQTRGFLYEMTPPVPVVVTKGRIRSARKVPPRASAPAD